MTDPPSDSTPFGLAPFLLEILACPADHHPVEADEAAGVLRCSWCATTYPVRDGIPVMLLDDATPGPAGVGNRAIPDDAG